MNVLLQPTSHVNRHLFFVDIDTLCHSVSQQYRFEISDKK
jgi:hypothetical protein